MANEISSKRRVEDILDLAGPVAYIIDQKKKVHQAVCPWCAKDIGKAKHLKKGTTFGELYGWLLGIQEPHMQICEGRNATEMQVQTEKREGNRV